MDIPVLFIPTLDAVTVWLDDFAILDGDTARDWWNDANNPDYFWEREDTH